MGDAIKFPAEIVEVKVKKTQSVDKEFVIKIITNDEKALDLQKYIADRSVTIEVYD